MPYGIGPAILRLTALPTRARCVASSPSRRSRALGPALVAGTVVLAVLLPAPAPHHGPLSGGRAIPVAAHHGRT